MLSNLWWDEVKVCDSRLTRCLSEACKELSCFAPLALAEFVGRRSRIVYRGAGRPLFFSPADHLPNHS